MAINGISQNQDPNVYARQYANQNGLSLDEAKAQLKEKYGNPEQPGQISGCGMNFGSQNSNFQPSSFNDPEFAVDEQFSIQDLFKHLANIWHGNGGPQKPGDPQRKGDTTTQLPDQGTDPNTYAKQYAEDNGITLEEAIEKLEEEYGTPERMNPFINE